jgi:hypothetical protein
MSLRRSITYVALSILAGGAVGAGTLALANGAASSSSKPAGISAKIDSEANPVSPQVSALSQLPEQAIDSTPASVVRSVAGLSAQGSESTPVDESKLVVLASSLGKAGGTLFAYVTASQNVCVILDEPRGATSSCVGAFTTQYPVSASVSKSQTTSGGQVESVWGVAPDDIVAVTAKEADGEQIMPVTNNTFYADIAGNAVVTEFEVRFADGSLAVMPWYS